MIYPKVSIIILNWNRFKDIVECLESVFKTTYPNYEVIVVDNASTDGSVEKLKKLFASVIILSCKNNLGFAGGNNVGIRHGMNHGAEYVWLLNNDIIVEPDTLCSLIIESEKYSSVGLLSPVLYRYSSPSQVQCCGSLIAWDNYSVKHFTEMGSISQTNEADTWLWGTALLIKRDVINKVGYLNEKYFAYHEDLEYSLRSSRAGYVNKYVPSAKIFHKGLSQEKRGNISICLNQFYYITRNEYWFWCSNLIFFKKIIFLRKYLVRVFRNIGYCKNQQIYDGAEAYLDAIYCAFCNKGGAWDKRNSMPRWLKKLMLWHPYFYSNLLDFNFRPAIKKQTAV